MDDVRGTEGVKLPFGVGNGEVAPETAKTNEFGGVIRVAAAPIVRLDPFLRAFRRPVELPRCEFLGGLSEFLSR